MDRTLVVVGYGMVAHRLVERLRAGDPGRRWRLVVLGEEPWPAYDRVSLTSCLEGRDARDLLLAGREPLRTSRVRLRFGTRVVRVDRRRAQVVAADGTAWRYDALVLATGARPFVPPVPGRDLPGCFAYRTLDDLEGIRAAARPGDPAVVIGGGLLGLEAANGLRALGMRPQILEQAPWPMPAQLDARGGELLAGLVGERGIAVRCGVSVRSLRAGPGGRVRSVALHDGTALDASLVVFASGVRPRDELAGAAGLATGERGGFLVDEYCRTADPRIWAVGDCAAAGGRSYGLVAPGYRMADTVAAQLTGGAVTPFTDADPSARLKLAGVHVAGFGDPHARTAGAVEFAVEDLRARRYAKLVLSEDGGVLLGGALVGDTAAFSALRSLVGKRLPGSADALLSRRRP
jgi:nitrite reductase (NADH) large subunit